MLLLFKFGAIIISNSTKSKNVLFQIPYEYAVIISLAFVFSMAKFTFTTVQITIRLQIKQKLSNQVIQINFFVQMLQSRIYIYHCIEQITITLQIIQKEIQNLVIFSFKLCYRLPLISIVLLVYTEFSYAQMISIIMIYLRFSMTSQLFLSQLKGLNC